MGGFLSNNFGKREEGGSTPLRASSPSSSSSSSPAGWCQLADDPRSPSAGIDRTPILVGRPDPEAPPEINLLDPRSPTVGIARTPLQLGAMPQDQLDKEVDVAPEVGPPRMVEKTVGDRDKEEQGREEEEGCEEDTKSDMLDLQAAQQGGRKPLGWRTSTQSCLKPVVQPKQLFQCGDISPILAAPSPTGPPQTRPLALKAVDTNSPRALVQRKAIRKMEANRQNLPDHPTQSLVVGKENCWH